MTKKHIVLGVMIAALLVFVAFTKWGGIGTEFFWNLSGGGTWLFPLVVVAAILDSINPCAFSMLLLTIAFLLSIGRLRSRILRAYRLTQNFRRRDARRSRGGKVSRR